jgi:hypothetical protein
MSKNKINILDDVSARLEGLTPHESLKESVLLLSELKAKSSINGQDFLKCLYQVIALNTEHVGKLRLMRAKVKLVNKHIGEQIDQVITPYNRLMFTEFSQLSSAVIENKHHFLTSKQDIAELFCNFCKVANEMLLWRYLDGQRTPIDTWPALNKAFQYAEFTGVLNVVVPVSHYALTSVDKLMVDFSTLYGQTLMLSTIEQSGYTPNEVRIVHELIALNYTETGFENMYNKDKHHFYINLYDNKGACHIRAFDKKANYRYVLSANLVSKIEDYLCAISTNKLPKDTKLRVIDSLSNVTRVLKKLNQEWSPKLYKRQRRASTRSKAEKMMFVAHGIESICKQLALFNGQKVDDVQYLNIATDTASQAMLSSAKTDLQGLEKWTLVDESETGFGVDLGVSPSTWIEPGKLVGCQHPKKLKQYVLAEIKTVKKEANGRYRAGLEVLSGISQSINLVSQVQKRKEVASGFYLEHEEGELENTESVSCLYIPQSNLNGKYKTTVILPLNVYQLNKKFKIQAVDMEVELGGAVEVHQDWVRALVRVV